MTTVNTETGELVLTTINYAVHPAAEIFPLITGADFRALVEDIRENGQQDPVVLDRDGRLIDGRNRARACAALGIDVRETVYEGNDVAQFVVSHNLHRRHLTDTQRAMVAARLANLPRGGDRGNQHTGGKPSDGGLPRAEVKSLLNVSEGSLTRAKDIVKNAIPAVTALASEGAIPLATGQRVANSTPEEQAEFVNQVRAGVRPDKAAPTDRAIVRPPAPPKYGGNRKRHLAVLDSMTTTLSGLMVAVEEITELDSSVTSEEAARLSDDLSKSIAALRRLNSLLKEFTK